MHLSLSLVSKHQAETTEETCCPQSPWRSLVRIRGILRAGQGHLWPLKSVLPGSLASGLVGCLVSGLHVFGVEENLGAPDHSLVLQCTHHRLPIRSMGSEKEPPWGHGTCWSTGHLLGFLIRRGSGPRVSPQCQQWQGGALKVQPALEASVLSAMNLGVVV